MAVDNTVTTRNLIFYGVVFAFALYFLLRVRTPEAIQVLREKASLLVPPLPPPLDHGVDARLEWGQRPVPASKLLRQAPGRYISISLGRI